LRGRFCGQQRGGSEEQREGEFHSVQVVTVLSQPPFVAATKRRALNW
jgi:hypothetical protein